MAKHKVLVDLWLAAGCSQDEDEVLISWKPINFSIYSDLFQDLVYDAVNEWLSENKLRHETDYELILAHVHEDEVTEYFEVIHTS